MEIFVDFDGISPKSSIGRELDSVQSLMVAQLVTAGNKLCGT